MCSLLGEALVAVNHLQNERLFESCLHHMMLVNVKLGISGSMRTVFEGCRFHCFSSFLMPQLKRSYNICIHVLLRDCVKLF